MKTIEELEEQDYMDHIILEEGEYISDKIPIFVKPSKEIK